MLMRAPLAFLAALLSIGPIPFGPTTALAQRQPASITTIPSATPQGLDVLDKTGQWVPMSAFVGATGTDVRTFGCKADGTDQTACINNALANASDCVIIPATPLGFYVAGTITVTKCLRGTVFNPTNVAAGPPLSYANTSAIICNNQVAGPCVQVNNPGPTGSGNSVPAQIENIEIIGKLGTPVDGSIGFQWKLGYNLIMNNVQFSNFGTCALFGPTGGAFGGGPISAHVTSSYISMCTKHYMVDDGVPELYFIGGRWGGNGGLDYVSADDYVFATKTTTSGGGGGPNTIVIDSIQLNGGTAACAFRWGGFAFTAGAFEANKIVNSHFEVSDVGGTSTASKGIFCMDSTVPHFPGMMVANNEIQTDGGTVNHPLFNIDPAVPWDNIAFFANNRFGAGASTLTIGNVAGSHGPVFINNYFPAGMSFVAGTGGTMMATNNVFGTYSVSGNWQHLLLTSNIGPITNTATGNVYFNDDQQSIAPVVTASGGGVSFRPTTQPLNNKNWDFNVNTTTGDMYLRSLTDDYASAYHVIDFLRQGTWNNTYALFAQTPYAPGFAANGPSAGIKWQPVGGTQPTDGKNWDLFINSITGDMGLRTLNDALTLNNTYLTFTRGTGYSLTGAKAIFATPITATAIPTSAGAGGLVLCIDSAGVIYKKASCP
jgi:hypothetical protein